MPHARLSASMWDSGASVYVSKVPLHTRSIGVAFMRWPIAVINSVILAMGIISMSDRGAQGINV